MKAFLVLLVYLFLIKYMDAHRNRVLSPTIAQGSNIKEKWFESGKLIFEDNFDRLDLSKWNIDGNDKEHIDEFQLYTSSSKNGYTQNGVLHLKPTIFNQDNVTENLKLNSKIYREKFHPIRSFKISTRKTFSFTYGVVEVKARVPSGDWLFPAIWLMPRDSHYGGWPASGEIDLMESRGNKHLTDSRGNFVGVQQVGSTLHWGLSFNLDKWWMTHFTKNNNPDFSSNFFFYKLIWTPQNINFYVNNQKIGTVTPPKGGFWEMGKFGNGKTNPWAHGTKLAPFDKQFYLILNLAVGGTLYFPDNYKNKNGKPWKNTSPNAGLDFWNGRNQWLPTWNLASEDSHFLIDYVRVWAL